MPTRLPSNKSEAAGSFLNAQRFRRGAQELLAPCQPIFSNRGLTVSRTGAFSAVRLFWAVCLFSALGASAAIASEPAVRAGTTAPDFVLPVIANAPNPDDSAAAFDLLRLSDYRGTVVYLDFWQVACAPCREGMPRLSALREEFSRQDVEFLAVNTDMNPRDAVEFVAANAVAYPIVGDPAGQVAERYGAHTLPTAFLIARDGTVARVHHGFQEKDIGEIRRQLQALTRLEAGGEGSGVKHLTASLR